MGLFKDLTGQKFGRLTVIKRLENNKHKNAVWMCECECGAFSEVVGAKLTSGKTKSCGCLFEDIVGRKMKTHGMSNEKIYRVWASMKERCSNPNCKHYSDYGGRGITVCEEWLSFEKFKSDMYESYLIHILEFGKKDTTIDRVNNNKGYSKSNCRWATCKEQNNNRRLHSTCKLFRAVSPEGEVFIANNQRKFAREHGLSSLRISQLTGGKLKGWSFKYIEHDKQIDKDTYITVEPASKNGDYGCKIKYKIIDNKFYVQDVEYFKGEISDNY